MYSMISTSQRYLIKFTCFVTILSCLTSFNLSFAKQDVDLSSTESISNALINIDKLRSSNPSLSQKHLAILSTHISKLNQQQNYYYAYLSAWKSLYQGEYLLAEKKLSSLLASDASTLIKFRANYSLLDAFALQQRWQEGLQQVAKVLTTSINIRDDKHFKTGLITVINFYIQVGQYQLALDYSKQLLHSTSENRVACMVSQLVLHAKLKANQLTIDSPKIAQGLNVCNDASEPISINLIRSYQAELNIKNNNLDAAINALSPHLVAIKSTNYNVLITLTYNLLAQAYHLKNDTQNTKKYALLALEEGKDSPKSKQIATTYQLLYNISEQEKKFEKALYFYKKFTNANQGYLNEVQAKQLAVQLASHNDFANKKRIEQQGQQIDLLNVQHLLTKKRAENSLLLIMLLVSFLIALAVWAYKSWLIQQHLKQLTEFDTLTNIHSRGHFIELAKNALKQSEKNNAPLTCILFDLDNFKKVNDHYGHAKGDSVLKEVTKVCVKIGRENDILGRLGGEEFAYILPGCSMIIAEDVANKCRSAIERIDYPSLGLNAPITASFGVSDCKVSGFELTSLLADADSAMYASKEHGKNCVNTFR